METVAMEALSMETLSMEDTRVDQWLWAIRLCSTRSEATKLCKAGHVRVNGRPAKAATRLVIGDSVDAYVHQVHRQVEVRRLIQKRVGAPVAVECYVDNTPPPPPVTEAAPLWQRDRGSGRPTKRDRRRLDRLRGRDT
ncbi:MAG: RNA-binding S4 domain-containing protein [Microthrixaceae bacterium]